MLMNLDSLQRQHQHEAQEQTLKHQQEQEQLLQQQHVHFQEQEATYITLSAQHQQEPTPQREHELLMIQQAGRHVQDMFSQQRQHLLERQHHDQLRLHERHWHQEQLVRQQIEQQQQQQQQQQQFHFQLQQQQQQQQQQQHSHHHHQQQQGPVSSHGGLSRSGYNTDSCQSFTGHERQSSFQDHHRTYSQSPDFTPDQSDGEAMDVDDEAQIQSIASMISNMRHDSSTPADISSFKKWASERSTHQQKENSDNDPSAIVILDTNILISHLNLLKSLTNSVEFSVSNHGLKTTKDSVPRILFIVPWVVIQELDGLKSGKQFGGELDLAEKSRRAIRYVETELEKPADRRALQGQKISESIEKQTQNDDRILDCCRYFKVAYPNDKKTRVTLFSNDRNLSVKALIHDIKTISREKVVLDQDSVTAAILGTEISSAMSSNDISMAVDGNTACQDSESTPVLIRKSTGGSHSKYRTEVNDREMHRIKSSSKITQAPEGMDPRLFDLTSHVIKNLRRFLEAAVQDHLRAIYGQDWKQITQFESSRVKDMDKDRDCRRLVQPFLLLQHYWREVFSDLFGSPSGAQIAKRHLDSVQHFVKSWDRVETFGLGKVYKKDLTIFLDDVDAILAGILTQPAMKFSSADGAKSMDTLHADKQQFYDASNRVRLILDWKKHCKALSD
ncbi:hypothetical protein BGW38_002540 [Lunasporangiospora selenospora]|uniref:PIN domain-containing protein n=1 Tax=Lunasporangiospora selenospora TaxID=979761 RepID=A0A9P6G3H1_9FUNG|nr:hypothetical protein BGW38_002540 [Lunasporangiospora selenospora]